MGVFAAGWRSLVAACALSLLACTACRARSLAAYQESESALPLARLLSLLGRTINSYLPRT